MFVVRRLEHTSLRNRPAPYFRLSPAAYTVRLACPHEWRTRRGNGSLERMAYDESAVIKSRVDAAPGRVWAALTDAEALAAWYWPASVQPRAYSDPVVGGRFGIDADGMGFSGQYLELAVPHRIVQSWRWTGDDRDSRVTIELTPAEGGTDLVVVHDQVDADTAEMYRVGWESCLTRLPAYLA